MITNIIIIVCLILLMLSTLLFITGGTAGQQPKPRPKNGTNAINDNDDKGNGKTHK